MSDLKEQRVAVKFCVKLGKSKTKTLEYLNTAYGDSAMKHLECFKWYKLFKTGWKSIEDDERPKRLSNDEKINTLMQVNQHLTIRDLSEECGIVGSCYKILTEKLKVLHC